MIYLCIKLMVALALFYSVEPAHADDTYNFYFQKSRSQNKNSSVKAETTVKTLQKEKKKSRDYKTWEISAGWGTVSGATVISAGDPNAGGWTTSTNYVQQMYTIGTKWNFSRFFDVHGALYLPSGPMDYSPVTVYTQEGSVPLDQPESTLDFQMMLGFGMTPLHFDFLGFDFLELGWDVSFFVGDENYLGGNSSVLVWGPRGAINFSKSLALVFSRQLELRRNRGSVFDSTSVQMAYRW